MNMFLIPANSKKSALILGLFKPVDLVILGIGVLISFILLLALPIEQMTYTIIVLTPGVFCAFLVFPVAYYQKFVWKGWCYIDEVNKFKK